MSVQEVQCFGRERQPSMFKSGETVAFSLWAVSDTRVSTEILIYPISSLIAEFGGALSLFLGISFITLWDKLSLNFPLSKVLDGIASFSPSTVP